MLKCKCSITACVLFMNRQCCKKNGHVAQPNIPSKLRAWANAHFSHPTRWQLARTTHTLHFYTHSLLSAHSVVLRQFDANIDTRSLTLTTDETLQATRGPFHSGSPNIVYRAPTMMLFRAFQRSPDSEFMCFIKWHILPWFISGQYVRIVIQTGLVNYA